MKVVSLLSVLLLCASFLKAQTINGVVLNNAGSPEPVVNVVIVGTFSGAFTDINGKFQLQSNSADSVSLRFSAIGYQTISRRVLPSSQSSISVQLEPSLHQLDEVVLQASRANRSTATTYSEIDSKTIATRNFGQDLPYIIDQEPNVVVNSDAGAGVGYTGIRIRGTDPTRINVTVNGIPINDSESHGVFWVNMPDFASSVDNIQIQRGVGTSGNGSAAFGASINMQTNTLNNSPYATVVNGYGSFNTWRHTISAGTGLIANCFSLDARLSKISSDGYIDRAYSDLKSLYVSAAFHGKKSLLRFNIFSGLEKTYQAWYGTPESRIVGNVDEMNAYADRNYLSQTDRDNLLNSGRTYNFYTYDNEIDNYQQDHYQLIFSHQFDSKFNLNLAGHYTKGKGYFEQFKAQDKLADYGIDDVILGDDTILTSDIIRRRWLDNHFYGATFSVNYTNGKRLNVSVGGGWNQYLGNHFGEVVWAQFAGNSEIRDRYYDDFARKNDLNIYAKGTYFVHAKVSLFADFQYRRIDYLFNGPVVQNDATVDFQRQNLAWNFINPKAGINYEITGKDRVYASFSVGNREPTRNDLTESTQLTRPKHESLYNTEVGYQRHASKYKLAANIYWMHYQNQLVLSGKVNDVGAYTRINVAQSDRYGIELNGTWNILKRLSWNVNASFSQNKILNFDESIDDYDNGGQIVVHHGTTDIAFSPNIVVGSQLTYNPINQLRIALITKYVGEQYLDNTSNDTRKLDPWILNNIQLSYAFKWMFFKEIGLAVQLNNITNELYEANGYTFSYVAGGQTTTENFYYPQAGFNFMTMLTVKF
jgi:iron complex outermembrane receptor protein